MNRIVTGIIALLLVAAGTWAQDAPATRPATRPAAEKPAGELLKAKATLVTKSVYARIASDAPWKRVKVGDTFGQGTEFRTGVGAQLVLTIADNSVVLVKSLTQVVLDTLLKRKDTIVTKLNLSQGRMKAGVSKGKFQSDFTISSPIASLSVRGTHPISVAFARDKGFLAALGKEGLLTIMRSRPPHMIAGGMNVAPGEQTDDKLTPAIVLASFGRMRRAIDVFYGLTTAEALVVMRLPNAPVMIPMGYRTWCTDRLRHPSATGSRADILRWLKIRRGLMRDPAIACPLPVVSLRSPRTPNGEISPGSAGDNGTTGDPFYDGDPYRGDTPYRP